MHRLSQMLLDLKISALVCAAIDSKNGSLVLMQTVFFLYSLVKHRHCAEALKLMRGVLVKPEVDATAFERNSNEIQSG